MIDNVFAISFPFCYTKEKNTKVSFPFRCCCYVCHYIIMSITWTTCFLLLIHLTKRESEGDEESINVMKKHPLGYVEWILTKSIIIIKKGFREKTKPDLTITSWPLFPYNIIMIGAYFIRFCCISISYQSCCFPGLFHWKFHNNN